MASVTYPLTQAGSIAFASAANVKWTRASAVVQENVQSVTGSGDTAHVFIHGLPVYEVLLSGVVQQTSGSTYALGQSSSLTPGIDIVAHEWNVSKLWQLQDVTGTTASGTADSEKGWVHGIPTIRLSVMDGTIQSDFGTDLDTESLSVVTNINLFGTLTGTLKVANKSLTANFATGGRFPLRCDGVFSTAPTYAGSSNFAWLFPTPDAPVKDTLVLDVDTETNISHAALLYSFAATCSNRTGGKVLVSARLRFDQATA